MVMTPPFHGVNGGSIPSRATKLYIMFKLNQLSNIKSHEADDGTLLFQTMKVHDDAGDVYEAQITEYVFRLNITKSGERIDFTHDLLLEILTQVEKIQFEIG